jgi:hypothetical protein
MIRVLKLIYLVLSITLLAYVIYTDSMLISIQASDIIKGGLYTQLILACILSIYEAAKLYENVSEIRLKGI